MPWLLGNHRAEAAARPLTPDTIRDVVARARRACLAQIAGFAATAAGFAGLAARLDGAAALVTGAVAALSVWGLLGAALSTWDHFRASIVLGRLRAADIAAETDAKAFWWKYRAVFPMRWEDG